jgi:hypothetical protein
MRQLDFFQHKKLRGVPRRLRALSNWADGFEGYYWLPDDGRRYNHWKIPVISSLVNPPKTRKAIQRTCINHMLRATKLIAESRPESYKGYYKVACLFILPWFHQSEVTIFYDPDYYAGFYSKRNELEPRTLSGEFGITIPEGFIERGFRIKDDENGLDEEWWTIGEPL